MDATLLEAISSLAVVVIGVLTVVFKAQLTKLTNKLDKEKKEKEEAHAEDIGRSMLCDKTITDVIAEFRVNMDADRAYVFQFHNGQFFTGKQPVWKLTCTHESVAHGISYEMNNLQAINVATVVDIIVPFWGGNTKGCTRLDDLTSPMYHGVYHYEVENMDNSLSRMLLESENISEMVLTPIISPIDDRVIGLLGIDYCTRPVGLPEDITSIQKCASTVSYLLSKKLDGACAE